MNRGSDRGESQRGEACGASMRPRFMNRGSDARAVGAGRHPRGFNEAPIHESGKCQTAAAGPA